LILFCFSALYADIKIGIPGLPFDSRFPLILLRRVLGAHDMGEPQREEQEKNTE
jgi:hypothetical protein